MNKLHNNKNPTLSAARAEHEKLGKERENLVQAIKDGVLASKVKNDLTRIAARRRQLERLLEGAEEEPVLLHPSIVLYHCEQVSDLAEALQATRRPQS